MISSSFKSIRAKRLLLSGASLLTLLMAQPVMAQSLSGVRGGATPGAAAPTTTTPTSTLPPLAQSALQRQTAIRARTATALDLANQAQNAARAAALARPSTVPNGMTPGGLVPAGAITTDPSLWQNAHAPVQTVGADGRVLVTIDQTAAKAILTWDSFNVGRDTTVHFDQSKGTQADGSNEWIALNRINDPTLSPSQIQGQIKAEGSVYLINRNGIIFSGSSQVNTHSLIASSLSFLQDNDRTIAQANQQFLSAGIGDPSYVGGAVLGTEGSRAAEGGDITIEAGALIETKEGGYSIIAGRNVSNAGRIVANGGQTILSAGMGLKFDFQNGTSGKLVAQSVGNPTRVGGVLPEFVLSNTGSIVSLRGDVTLLGGSVQQGGLVMATTSITKPGAITIEARSPATSNPADMVGGTVIFAPDSFTGILPDANTETTSSAPAADAVFKPGTATIKGTSIWFQHDSTFYAPGASLNLVAGVNDALAGSLLLNGIQNGRIQIDKGAMLSVAGLADVQRPMSDNLVTAPRVGQNELADSPLQRDGILYKSPLTVDGRDSGVRDDGLSWVGSPVANVGGYVQNRTRNVNQMLVDGGSINLNGGAVVLADGSMVDVSGGFTHYLGGSVQTSRLIGADGRVYTAATADPLMTYVGFAGQTTVSHSRWGVTNNYSNRLMTGGYESAYVEGGKGGALTISAQQMILSGALHADTVIGRYQIGAGREPQRGSLTLNGLGGLRLSEKGTSYADLGEGFDASTSLYTDERRAMATTDIDNLLWTSNVSSDLINSAGFGKVALNADMITVDADAALNVSPGGAIALTAGRMDVFGRLTAHSGKISLTSTGNTGAGGIDPTGPTPGASEALYPISRVGASGVPVRGDITIGDGAVLDVSGLWVNEFGANLDQRIGDSFVNGGAISITAQAQGQRRRTSPNGATGGAYDTSGSVILKEGSLLDATGGGYVDMLGHVALRNGIPVGKGGDIGLRIYADNPEWLMGNLLDGASGSGAPLTGARLELGGALKGYGLSGGGTLTLQTLGLRIGGDATGLSDYATHLSEDWFADQGFGAYKLSAIYDAEIAAGATVRVSQRNYLVDDLKLLSRLQTGGDISSVARLGVMDEFHRQATDFSLSGNTYLTWNAATLGNAGQTIRARLNGVTGSVTLGEGASILTDAGAHVALSAYGQLNVLGSIVAHGGAVDITGLRNGGANYDFSRRSVWLGENSLIDVSGVALIDPLALPVRSGDGERTPVSGKVLDGGTVSIQGTNAFVVAEQGSRIDVSGAKAVLDIRTQSNNPFAPIDWRATEVASNGGSVVLGSSNGLYFDGQLIAHGGNQAARGGALQIAALPDFDGRSLAANPPPSARSILVQQSGWLVTDAMKAGGLIEGSGAPSGVMHFAADRLEGSGVDTLVLGDDPTRNSNSYLLTPATLENIAFAGDVHLSLERAVMMNARNYVALAQGAKTVPNQTAGNISVGAGHVTIDAAYVGMAGGGLTDITPVLAGGDATLSVNARQIDLMGQFTLQRFARSNFTSSGDIRLMMPSELGYVSESKTQRPGELVTAGDLTFKAGQVYPASGNVFVIAAPTQGSTVTFLGNGSVAPPVSAGGALLVNAANIVQNGVIRAPSGTIQLGVGDVNDASIKAAFNNLPLIRTESVTLGAGSVTSVSLDTRLLPYGTTTDGKDWALIVHNSSGGLTKTGALSGAPEKLIGLAGDNVVFAEGATVDLSGGGNLYAQEWVPGTGGSRDLLKAVNTSYSSGALAKQTPLYEDGRQVYAIVPGYQAPVAAYDPGFGYAGQDQLSSLGKSVYISGVPGLPDGVYTLLPGQYATMEGAFRVVQQTGVTDSVTGDNIRLADGGQIVSGRFVDSLTGKQDARTTSFLIQSQDVWRQYSEYTLTKADDYFGAKGGTSAARTPVDAGRLVLATANALTLDGALIAKAGEKGRGAAVDISAQAIQIVGGAGQARDGYLHVDAASLARLGAESLLLGGVRSDQVNGTVITATASSVILSNDANSALTGPEVLLVTRAGGDGLILESGSVLEAKGDVANASRVSILIGAKDGASGDGALIRVSNGGAASVIRANVPGLNGVDGVATGLLDIRSGAVIRGGKSTTLDATGSLLLDPGASFSGEAVDVNANAIAFLGKGATANPAGFVVGESLLAQLANVGSLGLHSRSDMSFYGDVDLATKQALVLGAAAFVSDGGDVTITAPKLTLTNAIGGAAEFTRGDGRLTLNAGELSLGGGKATVRGFGAINVVATQGVIGQGKGVYDFGDLDVAMTAPIFTVESNANTTVKTTGALNLLRGAGAAPEREMLGGALSFSGGSLTTNAQIAVAAGNVTLAATAGDLVLAEGAVVSVKGFAKTFFDAEAYAPGGNLNLTASAGEIRLNQGATLDVSGSEKGGDAGGLTIRASGAAVLEGVLNGRAADKYRGGRLTLAQGNAVVLDHIADLTQTAGFTSGLSVTSGAGNLVLSEGKTLTGQVIYLAENGGDRPGAEDGNVIINGVIDVSGLAAGHIDLFGKSGVDIGGKLLAVSSVAHQDGGVITVGTTGLTDGTYDSRFGYQNVQAADSGVIRVRSGALIDVSGGSADSGGKVSFRAPLLTNGDVEIAIDDGAASIKGAGRVTIEPYAVWSTADATVGSQHFDGVIDPAGWYGADGKLVAGRWTDDKGVVLEAPKTDEEVKTYLSKYYFTPDKPNADHVGFFGYAGGDPANGPGTLMSFVQAPGFTFGNRYSKIANLHIRPGIELANPGEAVNGGNISVLTNWNLGAGETGLNGGVTLAYRYGREAPVLTVRAEHDIILRASITDGFYQQNDGAHLQDPVLPPENNDAAYQESLAQYQLSKAFLDRHGLWNGSINLRAGGTASLLSDPNYQPVLAPLTGQTDEYYANYKAYVGEIGVGADGKWADLFRGNQFGGFLNYSPNNSPYGDTLLSVSDFATYAEYQDYYQNSWLFNNFFDWEGFNDTTPIPLQAPIDAEYGSYSRNYRTIYIPGHLAYSEYVALQVGNEYFGTQLFYAPFAPRSEAKGEAGGGAYQESLAQYQLSKAFLDRHGLWNGSINLRAGGSASLLSDPNYQPVLAPLTGQTDEYYANYKAYVGEIGVGADGKWADLFRGNQFGGFLNYSPNNSPYGDTLLSVSDFATYAEYQDYYQNNWLFNNFFDWEGFNDTTPIPLQAPIDAEYGSYSRNYRTIYIPGHLAYSEYVALQVGNEYFGTQLFYAPFAPRSDAAADAGGGGGNNGSAPKTVPIAPRGPNNSPSNMPIAGRPVSLASATLLGGESASYRFVAGADFKAVDPLALNTLTGAGSLSINGHFTVVDSTTTDDAGNPLDPRFTAVGKTLVFPNLIRTGIGAIDIAAADDIRFDDALAPGAIYTGGAPAEGTTADVSVRVVRPGLISGAFDYSPTFLVTGMVQPVNGGNIRLTAGRDIIGNQQVFDLDGSLTKRKGSYIAQYWTPWLNSGSLTDNASSINFGNFAQGVLSAGGDVAVVAGRDLREVSVSLPTTWSLTGDGPRATRTVNMHGGGDLLVQAGGDILGGSYFVSKGTGHIDVGGRIGASFTYKPVSNPALSSPVSTLLAMTDAQVEVTARGDIDLGRVLNPGFVVLGDPFLGSLNQFTPESSLRLTSIVGDILFGSLTTPQSFLSAYSGRSSTGLDKLLPASLVMNALSGGLTIAGDGALYPSATGQLTLLASNDIRLVQTQTNGLWGAFTMMQDKPSTLRSILNPNAAGYGYPGTDPAMALLGIDGLLHFNDAEPARIYSLNGDIISGRLEVKDPILLGLQTNALKLQIPKAAQIRAGRDIVNLVFLGQNLHSSDVTSIVAGRDIINLPGGRQATGLNETYALPGLIQLAGPGHLDVQAGRDLGPLDRDVTDINFGRGRSGPSTGIQTIGNLYNPYLARESADISVLFGVGKGVAWNDFAAAYIDPAAPHDGLPSFDKDLIDAVARYKADMNRRSGGDGVQPTLTADEAWTAFQILPMAQREALIQTVFFKVLQITGADYNDPASSHYGQYARGYQAIETLFPSALGYTKNNLEGGANGAATQVVTGNLDMRGSTIQTQQGGNINIMGPGGQMLIGSTSSPPYVPASPGNPGIGPQSQGILAWERGDINIFADRSILLAQSRIFTERGGDMTIWSSNGDVSAGKGSKTSSEIKPVGFICSADFYCRIDGASQVTGAGIAAFPAGPDDLPLVTLVAPRGTVDFGDAGVRAGNLIVAAQYVANADNVQVQGQAIGVPANTVDAGANLDASSAAASAIQEAAQAMQDSRRNERPSIVTVDVLGFGGDFDSPQECVDSSSRRCSPAG